MVSVVSVVALLQFLDQAIICGFDGSGSGSGSATVLVVAVIVVNFFVVAFFSFFFFHFARRYKDDDVVILFPSLSSIFHSFFILVEYFVHSFAELLTY